MQVVPIVTSIFRKKDSIKKFIIENISGKDLEGSILAITTKIVSLSENRLVRKCDVSSKDILVKQEADFFLEDFSSSDYIITIKNGVLLPSAGIDESNSEEGSYILYPEDPMFSAEVIFFQIKKHFNLKKFGVIIVDSHTTPLRTGVSGVAISWCGFRPIYSYIGREDLFGRKLKCTKVNILDSIAASAVFVMGEGKESQPFALIKDIPRIEFVDFPPTKEDISMVNIPLEMDIYYPFLNNCKWRKK